MNDRLMKYQLKNNFISIFLIMIPMGIVMFLLDSISLKMNLLHNPNIERLSGELYKFILMYFSVSGFIFYFVDFNRSIPMGITRDNFLKSMTKMSIVIIVFITILLTIINYVSKGGIPINSDEFIKEIDYSNTFAYSNIVQNFFYFLIYSFMTSGLMNLIAVLFYKYKTKTLIGLPIVMGAIIGIMWNFVPVDKSFNMIKFFFFDFTLIFTRSIYIGLGINILIGIKIYKLIGKTVRNLELYN